VIGDGLAGTGGEYVARVTKIVAGVQVEYRLRRGMGCAGHQGETSEFSPGHGHDRAAAPGESAESSAQLEYRLAEDLPLVWIGAGLAEFGIEPGTVMTEEQKDWARALMSGAHPRTGEQLVPPVLRTDPAGTLNAAVLVEAMGKRAAERGIEPRALVDGFDDVAEDFGRLQRGVARKGEAHRISYDRAADMAFAAGIDLADVYGPAVLVGAKANAGRRIDIRTMGYDLTIDLGKSYSVLYAAANRAERRVLDGLYNRVIDQVLGQLQGDLAYGMTGHHGDGQRAARVVTSGLIGWRMDHRVARPVGGQAPDPHQHAHLVLVNLAKGEDGTWRAIAAGGRDLYRHAVAVNELVDHQYRTELMKLGASFARDEATGKWELADIGPGLRAKFSKRAAQAADELRELGIEPGEASGAQRRLASDRSRESKTGAPSGVDLDREWTAQFRAAHLDPAALVRQAVPGLGPDGTTSAVAGPFGPRVPDLGAIAAAVFDPQAGLTAHRKVVSRADVLAAVAAHLQGGQPLTVVCELTDRLLRSEHVVALPAAQISHLSNAQRYTTPDIVDAEKLILGSTRARFAEGAAVLPAGDAEMAISAVEASRGHSLGTEQKAFISRALTGGIGIDALIGTAGAGKTVLTEALRVAYQARGMVVGGAALAASAGAGLQLESGIPTRTIAAWLASIDSDNGAGLTGVDVLVVDEAAMADDRQMSRLVAEAQRTGTKLILVGDPLQLRSPGVGGTFKAVHELVGGLQLLGNRRQVDAEERAALALWRQGKRRETLTALAGMGRVHVTETASEAFAGILTRYAAAAAGHPEVHERISRLLVLAATNEGADRINTGVRAVLRAEGRLPAEETTYSLAAGRTLRLSVGDQVMLRKNDYRSRLDPSAPDVLNGYRGVVKAIDARRNVLIEWRSADGRGLVEDWVTPGYVAGGGVSLAYAITVAKSQGMTCDRAIVYGVGLDAHTLYPALTRARHRTDLILPRQAIESPERQYELGEPATPGEALARAVHALADHVQNDRPDDVVVRELGEVIAPIVAAGETARATSPGVEPATASATVVPEPIPAPSPGQRRAAAARATSPTSRRAEAPASATTEKIRARDGAIPVPQRPWRERPAGRFSDADLAEMLKRSHKAVADGRRIEQLAEAVRAGRGPAVTRLTEQAPIVRAQGAAIEDVQAARRNHTDAAHDLRMVEGRRELLRGDLARIEALRGPAAWLSRGERRDLQARIEVVDAERARARQRVDALRANLTAAEAAVAVIAEYLPTGQNNWRRILDTRDRHTHDWNAMLSAARQEDRTTLVTAPMMFNADPERVARAARDIPLIQAEIELRDGMAPAARTAEDRARAEYAQAQQAERAAARHSGPKPYRRPPTIQRPGPQPGHGR
jgi:conjugative relaxase-like TrwC/TraI family protein